MTSSAHSLAAPDSDACHVGVFAARTPDAPAIIAVDEDRIITFADYEALSNRCAHLIRSRGLVRGDRLMVFMENNALYLPLVWGGIRAGLRVTTVATHLGAEEVNYLLADSGARMMLASHALQDVAAQLHSVSIAPDAWFMLGASVPGYADLDAALAQFPDTPIADQSEGVEMLYSSGTTGRPKAVKKPLPDGRFGVPTPALLKTAELYGFDADTVYYHPAPLYHAAPLVFSLRAGRLGATCIVTRRFDAVRSLAIIGQYRVTHSQWVPTHFSRLLRLPDHERALHDVSSLQVAIHAAAPCPVPVKRAMIAWWGPVLREYYAGSEGNGSTHITSEEWLRKPGSVGRAATGILHVCDDEGRELPAGAEGTVFFEGGPPFEYHNEPDKTAASRTVHGWSTLGDIGYLDEDGYLFLTDRKSFMIVSGGVNIYPQESESLLAAHPAVVDVAVFGVPNADFGEEVKAVVQPADMEKAGPALESELIEWCRSRLSAVKCPRSIDFSASLPREENGKLYKRKLRDAYWAAHREASAPDRAAGHQSRLV